MSCLLYRLFSSLRLKVTFQKKAWHLKQYIQQYLQQYLLHFLHLTKKVPVVQNRYGQYNVTVKALLVR